jgi:hypothetical protein
LNEYREERRTEDGKNIWSTPTTIHFKAHRITENSCNTAKFIKLSIPGTQQGIEKEW